MCRILIPFASYRQYVAGVGNDQRASRQFNTIKQAKDYDSHGEYVKMWIPALRNLHPDYVHTPWLLDEEERRRYGLKTTKMDVTLVGYPERPMLELESWKKHYERREGVGSKMRGNPQEKVKDARLRRLKQKTPGRSTGFTAGGQHPHSSPYHHPSTQGGGNSVYPDAQSYDYLASSSGHGNSSEPQKSMLPPLRNLPTPSGQAGRFPTPPVERRGSPFGGPSGSARGSFSNSALSSGNAPGMRAPRGISGGVLSHQSSAPPAVSPGLSGTPTGASKADTEMSWRKPATPSNGGPATGGGSS
jgi:deoxyribodipyrimidine photo-lyase